MGMSDILGLLGGLAMATFLRVVPGSLSRVPGLTAGY